MKTFSSFVDAKELEHKEHLFVLYQILKRSDFKVANHLDEPNEPYIFVHKPDDVDSILDSLSFDGVRVYTRGKDLICYRAQNKETTEPFGNTYMLNITGMFKELIHNHSKEQVGRRIIFLIIKQLKDFFIASAKAEREDGVGSSDMGSMTAPKATMGTDYSQQVVGSIGTNYG